jgi:hypothetical protein
MTRPLAGAVLVVWLAACDDFDKDLAQYCTVHPEKCGDAGAGGGSGGGSGATGGGTGGCGDFGASCSREGDCCATTTIGGTPYPLGCGRIDYCELVPADCRPEAVTCADAGQCCSRSCTAGRCDKCFAEGTPCTTPENCCPGAVCGNDGACHAAGLGMGPVGGTCKSSADCNLGWCEKDGGITGVCADPATHSCHGLQASTQPCCSGLNYDPSFGQCCMPAGQVCTSSFDCCVGGCYGGRCADNASALGGPCSGGSDCNDMKDFCDPVGKVCIDRWCFRSAATPYAGCCVFTMTGSTCVFPDGGSCVLPTYQSATKEKCCSGLLNADGMTCSDVVIFD